jgi:hypothetical protein
MKAKKFMNVIPAINFLIGTTIHFGMAIMLQILIEVILFCIFVQKNVKKNIRVILTEMLSKVTYNYWLNDINVLQLCRSTLKQR